MYIKRKISINIERVKALYPALLVTGPRQTGKTFLSRHEFPAHAWVLLDEAAVVSRAKTDPGLFLQNHPPPAIYDEVQRVNELFLELKAWIDSHPCPPASIILTGSQPLTLMEKVSDSLAGRIGIFELPPMTQAEIFEVTDVPLDIRDWLGNPPIGRKFLAPISVTEMLFRGGFPRMALREFSPTPNDSAQRLSDYIQTYLTRDLRDLSEVADLGLFETFMRHLATQSGRLLQFSAISHDTHVPQSTVSEWMGLLRASHLFWTAPGYTRNLSKRAAARPKCYCIDTGLMISLLGYQSPGDIERSPLLGTIFETSAANALRLAAQMSVPRVPLHHYRYDESEEVDLVLELDATTLCPVEIKYSTNLSKSDCAGIETFRKRNRGASTGIVVSPNTECFWLTKDILHIPWLAL